MESGLGIEEGAGVKVRATIDINVAMGDVSHDGTGCQGYLTEGTRYEDIVRVFGKPQLGASLDGKIKVEWVGRINGLVFTIYDYKSRLDSERNINWHIGAKVRFAAELVRLYFNKIIDTK